MSSNASTLEPPPAVDVNEMDQEDLARVLTAFRGQPVYATPSMHYIRRSADGAAPAYVFDDESGMVYILD
ncbi:MAG: hypothetical protein ACHQQR_02460 [Gemmatimonadales bacterium]|jgi:hypothetical protein